MAQDPRAATHFAKDGPWMACQQALRAILAQSALEETYKWRGPCYVAHGGNVAMIAALKDGAVLSFFKGVLLSDPQGLLAAPGENSRSARWYKCTDPAQIERDAAALHGFVGEAIANEAAGRKVDMPADDLTLPDELTQRLDKDPEFQRAWEALTPGRRRGYVVHFAGAKQPATRLARIDKHAPRIAQGKGMHDR